MSKREHAAAAMNRFGERGEPFLFLIDFEMDSPEVLTPGAAAEKGILYDIGGATNAPVPPPRRNGSPLTPHPVAFREYERAFDAVQEELRNGNSYLLNLTFPTRIETDLALEDIFHAGPAKYRLLYPGRFVCFSPELFVRISGRVISSCPMKGTIDAAVPDAEDRILADPKELAEHNTIVDLIRNDLNMVSTGVSVERFRYVDRISTSRGEILQISSLITGRLPGDYRSRLGDIVFALLPAGSVSGAPKKKTLEIIRRTEGMPRGFFTGVAGWFDGSALESCVMIRFIEERPDGTRWFRSGGGITVRSVARAEYDEMVGKVYVPAF